MDLADSVMALFLCYTLASMALDATVTHDIIMGLACMFVIIVDIIYSIRE